MSGRELDALATATAGEALAAVVYAVWRWKGWIAAATDGGLYLSRRPRVFGRGATSPWRWRRAASRCARAARSASTSTSATERVELRFMGPHDEFVALLEAARGPGEVTTEEIRELARTKLGSRLAFGYEATIDGAARPPGARRARRAPRGRDGSTSPGLLVVTDRRLLLLDVGVRSQRALGGAARRRSGASSSSSPSACGSTFGDEVVTFTDDRPPIAATSWPPCLR